MFSHSKAHTMFGISKETQIILVIYIMGIAAHVLVTCVCDTILYYYTNKKSWKNFSLKEIDISLKWSLFSWFGVWYIIEFCIGTVRLESNKNKE